SARRFCRAGFQGPARCTSGSCARRSCARVSSRSSRTPRSRAMEVILREFVEKLGKRGEIVKVSNGYARNYLLPRKLALPATEGNKKHVERERKIMDTREADEKAQAEALGARLTALDITI